MAWPSWFPYTPTGSRPSNWDDWPDLLKQVVPRQWPHRLFAKDSEAWLDLEALGESLALMRDILQFMQRGLWPGKDIGGTFVSLWEAVFDLEPAKTLALRKQRLEAAMRQRGTMNQQLVKAIMAAAWGHANSDLVGLESPTQGWTASDDQGGAFLGDNMHIYDVAEAAEPDPMIIDLIAKTKPTWQIWSYGQYKRLKWGVAGAEGSWDNATWG